MNQSLIIKCKRYMFLLVLAAIALVLVACPAEQDQEATPVASSGGTATPADQTATAEVPADQPMTGGGTAPRYVASIAPLGMILSELCAGRAEVSVLLPPGASPHTYEPLPSDLRAVEHAEAFFYVDDVLDGWAADLGGNNTFAVGRLVPAELRLGLVAHDHHAHAQDGHGHEAPHKTGDEPGYADKHGEADGTFDPHFWTSPRTVQAILPVLAAELARLDPAG